MEHACIRNAWVVWLVVALLPFASLSAAGTSWKKAELQRKFIREEGAFDPEDWVFIFLIPKGAYYRTVAKSPDEKAFAEHIGGSPLGKDEGTSFEQRTMIQFQVGGMDRLKAALMGKAMNFETFEKRFWVEWHHFPKDFSKASRKHPYPRAK